MIDKILNRCRNVLQYKKLEYSHNQDRFHNFNQIAKIEDKTPERALWDLYLKHFVSVQDIVHKLPDEVPSEGLLEEKITDSINYLILLEIMIKNRGQEDSTINVA